MRICIFVYLLLCITVYICLYTCISHQEFTQTQVDPLHKRVDEVNKAGLSLMRSAGSAVSTDNIEADLDAVNNKWSKLAEQVSPSTYNNVQCCYSN